MGGTRLLGAQGGSRTSSYTRTDPPLFRSSSLLLPLPNLSSTSLLLPSTCLESASAVSTPSARTGERTTPTCARFPSSPLNCD